MLGLTPCFSLFRGLGADGDKNTPARVTKHPVSTSGRKQGVLWRSYRKMAVRIKRRVKYVEQIVLWTLVLKDEWLARYIRYTKRDVTEAIVKPRLVSLYGIFIISGANKQRKCRSEKNVVVVFVGHWGSQNIAFRLVNMLALSRGDAEILRCRVCRL